jgi:hypothetical protein
LFDTLGSVEACAADVAFTASTHDRAVSRDTGANHVAGVTLAIPIRAFHLGLHLPAPYVGLLERVLGPGDFLFRLAHTLLASLPDQGIGL